MPARFDHAGGSVVFSRAPLYPSGEPALLQPVAQSGGAVRFAWDNPATEDTITLQWRGMSRADKEALETFWRTVVKGMMEIFTYTDIAGTAITVRFAEPVLSISERAFERYDVTVKLLKS